MSNERTIVCLSSQRWDDGMWTNKQHVMSRLARDHQVVYVNYGLNPLPYYLYKRARSKPSDLLKPWRTLTDGFVRRDGNLHILDGYAPFFTGAFSQTSAFRDFFTFDFKLGLIQNYLEREGLGDPILWVYHPAFGDAVDKMPHELLIYDCVDNYAAFPSWKDKKEWVMGREEKLCRNADLVFTTAQELYEVRKPYNPDNTHLVHNVGDARHFKKALDPELEVADEIEAMDGPVIGFVGAVSNYKLNFDWIAEAAEARPGWHFAIIGPVGLADSGTDIKPLRQLENVHLLGHRDYEDLPAYLKGFDVATIPYRRNEYTQSCFPIKFFEYMATGTPIVISDLPALEPYYDATGVASTSEAFIDECEAALERGSEGRERRIELAEQNSWESKVEEMMGYVEAKL